MADSKRKKARDHVSTRTALAQTVHSSPLTWWRTKRADEFDSETVQTMRASRSTIGIIREKRWRPAATGDAAAAIGIVYSLGKSEASKPIINVVMSALAACAADGNAAACVVMSNIIRQVPGAGALESKIATGWLTRAFVAGVKQGSQDAGGAS